MNNNQKMCFIDVETTGTDRKNNNIFQLSATITDDNGDAIDSIDLLFRPHCLKHYEQEAFNLTGYTLEQIEDLSMSSAEAFEKFISWLCQHVNQYDKKDKLQFVAYNAKFDSEFVREWFEKNNNNYYGAFFWNPSICIMQAAAWFTHGVRSAFPNFKLQTICKCAELGWNDEDAHDARYDLDKTIELYKYLRKNMSNL